MKIIVTGGAGFIGTSVCRLFTENPHWQVVNLDKLTYAANRAGVEELSARSNYRLAQIDVADRGAVAALIAEFAPGAILHLAAESHVDRSIDDAAAFVETNIVGTYVLLEAARHYWQELDAAAQQAFRFHHVSTDEVFGSLGPEGQFSETSLYRPNSPYAASKAGSDHLARAWHHTYGMPVLISNCSNNYGPGQFPEKLIPVIIANALEGRPLPVYGRGENVRDWLYVDDHARALCEILTSGVPGESYNVGGGAERRNIDLVETLCVLLDEMVPDSPHRPHRDLIEFVTDRPGHDLRYAIDDAKLRRELGWRPQEDFDSGLRRTLRWYLDNQDWVARISGEIYDRRRLGLSGA